MSDDIINPSKQLPAECKYKDVEWDYIGYGIHRGILHKCLIGCVWMAGKDIWRYRLDCKLIGQWSTVSTLEVAKRRLFQDFCVAFFHRLPDEDDNNFSF